MRATVVLVISTAACHGGGLVGFEQPLIPDAGSTVTCASAPACRHVEPDVSGHACVVSVAPDGERCSDACLTEGTCHAGVCEGTARSCDDGDACTVDVCEAATGCGHVPRVCPAPADPCRAAACDPLGGCLEIVASDGTRCGPSDCVTAHVCIAGACVARPVPASAACAVSSLSAGYGHTCATFASGATQCWGGNSEGQVGDGTQDSRDVETMVAATGVVGISSGAAHTCGIAPDGTLRCWGDNTGGDLGDGTDQPRASPVVASAVSGAVAQVSCGRSTTCVLLAGTGAVQCFGDSTWGQRGEGSGQFGLAPNDVAGLTPGAVAIAAGWEFTCALGGNGAVQCWGHNNSGQLGVGPGAAFSRTPVTALLRGAAVALTAGGTHACALLADGSAQCWGSNADGQLGSGGPQDTFAPVDVTGLPGPVTAISAGYWHTCAISMDEAWCWGSGYTGQLGDALKQTSHTPVRVALGVPVRAIAAGGFHSCAALADGTIACWGSNGLGQVGNATRDEQDAPAIVVQ
jgi:alpha-tubulin suppressor-like RCC1 family protein